LFAHYTPYALGLWCVVWLVKHGNFNFSKIQILRVLVVTISVCFRFHNSSWIKFYIQDYLHNYLQVLCSIVMPSDSNTREIVQQEALISVPLVIARKDTFLLGSQFQYLIREDNIVLQEAGHVRIPYLGLSSTNGLNWEVRQNFNIGERRKEEVMEFWPLVTTGVGQRNFFSSLSSICSDLQGFILSVIFPFFNQ